MRTKVGVSLGVLVGTTLSTLSIAPRSRLTAVASYLNCELVRDTLSPSPASSSLLALLSSYQVPRVDRVETDYAAAYARLALRAETLASFQVPFTEARGLLGKPPHPQCAI